jgi:hypothetical protein
MEFDRESEFERIMEEIMPLSIPNSFVREIVVKLKNGGEISLSGEELLKPLPMTGNLNWEKVAHQHDQIEDIEVLVNVPLIQDSVIFNVKRLLSAHFGDNDQGKLPKE